MACGWRAGARVGACACVREEGVGGWEGARVGCWAHGDGVCVGLGGRGGRGGGDGGGVGMLVLPLTIKGF